MNNLYRKIEINAYHIVVKFLFLSQNLEKYTDTSTQSFVYECNMYIVYTLFSGSFGGFLSAKIFIFFGKSRTGTWSHPLPRIRNYINR